jgi:hypothetical protein
MITALAFYQCAGFRRLDAPVGRTAHGHNDCWMMLDLAGWYCAQESWPM